MSKSEFVVVISIFWVKESLGISEKTLDNETTVEPVLSSTVISDHPILSGRLRKSRICFNF